MIGNTNARGNNITIENSGGTATDVSKNTTFNSDGSITETDANNNVKTTVFNSDGSITETLKGSDGTVLSTKTTNFNADGSISEVVR